ncbi:hypothetical protein [uncultured Robinsoniella sp.]
MAGMNFQPRSSILYHSMPEFKLQFKIIYYAI